MKGFLGQGERPDHFASWLASHRALVESEAWGPRAHGFCWESGSLPRVPLPAAGAAKLALDLWRRYRQARRVAMVGALGLMAAEQAVRLAGRLAGQYLAAARSARERAEHFAARLERLAGRYDHVRVVAHSLGCVQVIEAASALAPGLRPTEIHLCAPACREEDVAEQLGGIAQERAYLYYSRSDLVLEAAFRVMARGRALGAVGPSRAYPGVRSVDVGPEFGFRVHGDYKRRLPQLVARARDAPRPATGGKRRAR